MLNSHDLANRAAGRMTKQMGPFDPQNIHQPDEIARHLLDRIGDFRAGALSATPMVMGYDLEMMRKFRDLGLPIAGRSPSPETSSNGGPWRLLIVKLAIIQLRLGHRFPRRSNPQPYQIRPAGTAPPA